MAVKPEKVHGPPAGNFFKRRVEKTYLIWKAGGRGGVARPLTKKIDPG
jgi:hypothetical protein